MKDKKELNYKGDDFMRTLDRLISFIYSVIMLMVAIVLILVGVGVVNPQMILDMQQQYVFTEQTIGNGIWNVITITGIVLLLASLKTTIFLSLFKIKDKSPILVKTKSGEIEIAQETITNTVRNVAMSYDAIRDVQAKMIKKKSGVIIYAVIMVYADSNIRAITEQIQNRAKEVIKETTGVTVYEVNIKVKNIYQKGKRTEDEKVVAEPMTSEPVASESAVPQVTTVKPTTVEQNSVEAASFETVASESTEETTSTQENQQ